MIDLLKKLFSNKEETTINLVKEVDNRCPCETGSMGWCHKHKTDWL